MLIPSSRVLAGDAERWAVLERTDRLNGAMARLQRREEEALRALDAFLKSGAYVGVSWGKDSLAVAHLAWRVDPHARIAYFPAGPAEMPECYEVRDRFLAAHGSLDYIEIEAATAEFFFDGHDGAQADFERVSRSLGRRYVSGVRAAESGIRKLRMRKWGVASPNTCAPIGWWETADVFAYLAKYDLPVHPAYSFSLHGSKDRNRLRVGTIGGYRGREWGRREWEESYYSDILRRLSLW